MTAFVTVEGRTLATAMKALCRIVERRTTIPILSCVRVTRDRGAQLRLETTDLSHNMQTVVDIIDCGEEFDVCVNAAMLLQIAKQAGPAPVKITTSPAAPEHKDKFNPDLVLVDIADGDASYDLHALPAEDWPTFPGEGKGWQDFETFTNGRLAECLDKVAPCISTEETRYYLNGVAWQHSEAGCTFTATDGHRLSSYLYSKPQQLRVAHSTIIPRRTVMLLQTLAKGKDVTVSARWSVEQPAREENGRAIPAVTPAIIHLRYVFGQTTIEGKCIDGTFPDWRRVVPTETPHRIEFKAEALAKAIDSVVMLSSERGRAVRIYRETDGDAWVAVSNPDRGKGRAKAHAQWPDVPVSKANKAHDSFGFNAYYLRSAIGRKPTTFFTLKFSDSASPFLIETADEDLTRVLMPMRV